MTPEEKRFYDIGSAQPGAESGKLFGKPCFKRNGKAFLCFFKNEIVFKLTGDAHAAALAVPGAQLFDPSGKGRPMKEWVQVPPAGNWEGLAASATELT
jgi:hypothetical protein